MNPRKTTVQGCAPHGPVLACQTCGRDFVDAPDGGRVCPACVADPVSQPESPSVPLRAFPVPRPVGDEDDPRYTFGLLRDVAKVIESHGYPAMTGPDVVELSLALFRVIYGEGEGA